jgi:DNA-binding NarL/FixJ family response regulator
MRQPANRFASPRLLLPPRWPRQRSFKVDSAMIVAIKRDRPLSRRESQIAMLIRAGHSGKAIAHELNINLGTVSSYIRRIRRKLQTNSRRDLVARLARRAELAPASNCPSTTLKASIVRLSPAELAVLQALLVGRTNQEIAANRGRSLPTIACQVSAILRKMGVSSRAEIFARFAESSVGPYFGASQ